MTVCRLIVLCALSVFLPACEKSDHDGHQSSSPDAAPGATVAAASGCSLVMGWDPWEPYQYQIDGTHVFGLDVDLLTAVVHNADCTLEFKKGSWAELLAMLNEGEVDVLAGATQTSEREEFAHFTSAYRDEEFLVYVLADRFESLAAVTFEEMAEQGMKIGVIDGYLYGEPVASYQDDSRFAQQFHYSPMSEISISLLLDGEVDALIEDKYVGASIIRRKNLSDSIRPHPVRFDTDDVHFMFSRASVDEATFERINQSLDRLLEDGQIQIILAQYQNQ
ncbi:MAG: transporter substrate-binding domain-containing protein [Xanthomonadales bacterium]|nr:transporter substrate-binding domain-containing protein [Xanthomonadales bacterium]NNL94549.1 transporter substrate-binding domain-containing protein [Xanthomonadales bacterium]